MESMEFYKLFISYWGKKASMVRFSKEKKMISCTLYDSFPLRCGLGGNYGTFEGGIVASDGTVISEFCGGELSINKDIQSILDNFMMIENYCRLRLPDKFLVEYDKIIDGN